MAPKKKAPEKNARRPGEKPIPEGMTDVGRSNLVGWFVRQPGNEVRGYLRGSFTLKGKFGDRKVYRVELTQGETMVTDTEGDDVEVSEGTIGVDETGFLKRLADVQEGREIWLHCVGQDKPLKGQRMGAWRFQVAVGPEVDVPIT